MSATGTQLAKKSGRVTKSQAEAQAAASKLGAVIVPINGGQGYTLVNKAEAERRKLIDIERAKLDAQETKPAQGIVDPVPADHKTRKESTEAMKAVKKGKKPVAVVIVEPVKPTKAAKKAQPVEQPAPKAVRRETPEGMKWCNFHQAFHPATLEVFASNKADKSGLFSVCKVAEKAQREARKARLAAEAIAQTATAQPAQSNVIPMAATSKATAKAKKRTS